MKSENAIRSPLLLFNYYFLTQYVLLFFCLKTKRLCFYFLIPYVLLFFCLKLDIKKRESSQTPNLH